MGREFNSREFREYLENQDYQSVFWTGHDNEYDDNTEDIAKSICEEHNQHNELGESEWKTLEMQLDDAGIDMPDYEENPEVWKEASNIFAEEASGDAYVVKGENVDPKGVFNTEELPEIKSGRKVDSLTTLNTNGEETGEVENFSQSQPPLNECNNITSTDQSTTTDTKSDLEKLNGKAEETEKTSNIDLEF